MNGAGLEAFLAKIYVDAEARARFRAAPRAEASRAGLSAAECDALERMDWAGLELAARSFERKRAAKRRDGSWWRRLVAWPIATLRALRTPIPSMGRGASIRRRPGSGRG